MSDHPLNAIGRRTADADFQPFHIDEAGVQRDSTGLRILPMVEIYSKNPAAMKEWLDHHGLVPIKLARTD